MNQVFQNKALTKNSYWYLKDYKLPNYPLVTSLNRGINEDFKSILKSEEILNSFNITDLTW